MISIRDGQIDPHGIYGGPPYGTRIRFVQSLTMADHASVRYWRRSSIEGWRRLRTDEHLRQLNEALDVFS